jgi:hypothetical protein
MGYLQVKTAGIENKKVLDASKKFLEVEKMQSAVLIYTKLSINSYFIIKYRYGKSYCTVSAEEFIDILIDIANS